MFAAGHHAHQDIGHRHLGILDDLEQLGPLEAEAAAGMDSDLNRPIGILLHELGKFHRTLGVETCGAVAGVQVHLEDVCIRR